MKLISKIYREFDERNLSRVSFSVLIVAYYVFHSVIIFIIGMFNISNNPDGMFLLLQRLCNLLFIPVNTIFLVIFCYIMFIRASTIQLRILRNGIIILTGLSVIPFLLFCFKDAFVSNSGRDILPIMLRYIYFKEGLSDSLGFNWELIDVIIPVLLLLPKNKKVI